MHKLIRLKKKDKVKLRILYCLIENKRRLKPVGLI